MKQSNKYVKEVLSSGNPGHAHDAQTEGGTLKHC
jgi:hypothetical protein